MKIQPDSQIHQIFNFIILIKISTQINKKFQNFGKINNNLIYAKTVHVLRYEQLLKLYNGSQCLKVFKSIVLQQLPKATFFNSTTT